MKIKLKPAKNKDFKEIARIYAEEFSKPPYNENLTFAESLKKIKLFSKNCDIWKINYKKNLVGFIIVNPYRWKGFCFGEKIAIRKESQGRGIGKFVFKEIFKVYKNKGFKNFVGIINKKSNISNLYKKIGFKINKENIFVEKKLK